MFSSTSAIYSKNPSPGSPRAGASSWSASVGALFVVRSLAWQWGGRRLLAKAKRVGKKSTHFTVEVREGNLVVSLLNGKFKATYYKPPGRPNLILRERTKTDDEALVAEAFQAAVAKARELGWIV
jgi:hypothetical protein